MSVTLQKFASITPSSGALDVRLEKNGPQVSLTATVNSEVQITASIPWRILWTSTFLKDKKSKKADSRLGETQKRVRQGSTPSTLDLYFVTADKEATVSVTTGDLRQALLAIK